MSGTLSSGFVGENESNGLEHVIEVEFMNHRFLALFLVGE